MLTQNPLKGGFFISNAPIVTYSYSHMVFLDFKTVRRWVKSAKPGQGPIAFAQNTVDSGQHTSIPSCTYGAKEPSDES